MFLLALLLFLVGVTYLYLRKCFNHWNELGVKQVAQNSIFGSLYDLFKGKRAFAHILEDDYAYFKDERYFGMYQFLQPVLIIKDAELIKDVAIKHFDHFTDHQKYGRKELDFTWSRTLLGLMGQEWHSMRSRLSPVFTGSKMKFMYPLVNEIAERFADHFHADTDETVVLEMKGAFTRITNDMICACMIGVRCDSLKDPENEFYQLCKRTFSLTGLKKLMFFAYSACPTVLRILRMKLFTDEIVDYFRNILTEAIRMREEQGVVRPDLIQLLLESRRKGEEQYISDEDILAQTMIFFLGGFDTSSYLMSFVAYELAVNAEVQDRLRRDVDEMFLRSGGRAEYEDISELKYLDMVISETLRKWPVVPISDRACTKDYTIEPKTPSETPLRLKKGDIVWIPTYAVQRDPENFPDPDRFDPERFNEQNKSKVNSSNYLPFGSGPRSCIGSRFAMMENKTLFVHLLRKFEIVAVEKTVVPLELSRSHFNLTSDGGLWLGLKKRPDLP